MEKFEITEKIGKAAAQESYNEIKKMLERFD